MQSTWSTDYPLQLLVEKRLLKFGLVSR
ncbi:hypothetical protein LINPERPRIM_LOCUS30387 [Linum perenne]